MMDARAERQPWRRLRLGKGKVGLPLSQLLVIAAAIAVWQVAHVAEVINPAALPSVPDVFRELVNMLGTSKFWFSIKETLSSAVIGLLVSVVVGVPLGLITGSNSFIERSTRASFEFGRAYPTVALLPVLVLILGANTTMKSFVVFLACVFPLTLQSQYGARTVSPTIRETVRAFRVPPLLRYVRVTLPAASPSIMTGVRLAATTAVLVSVGVEILTALPGIGRVIADTQVDGNPPLGFAYVIAAGCMGFGIARLFAAIERRVLRWRPPLETK